MGTQISIYRKVSVRFRDDTMFEKISLDGLRNSDLEICRHQFRSVTYEVANFGDNLWPIVNWLYTHLDFYDKHRIRVSRTKLKELIDAAKAVLEDKMLAPTLFPLDETDIDLSGMNYDSEEYWNCFPVVIDQVGTIMELPDVKEKLIVCII